MLGKMLRITALLDVYAPLLTERQREMCGLYYLRDYSLSEISELSGVSRQAVHDTLARSERAMEEYERQFGLVRRSEHMLRQLDAVGEALSSVRDSLVQALAESQGSDGNPGTHPDCGSGPNSSSRPGGIRAHLLDAVCAIERCQSAVVSIGADVSISRNHDGGFEQEEAEQEEEGGL